MIGTPNGRIEFFFAVKDLMIAFMMTGGMLTRFPIPMRYSKYPLANIGSVAPGFQVVVDKSVEKPILRSQFPHGGECHQASECLLHK